MHDHPIQRGATKAPWFCQSLCEKRWKKTWEQQGMNHSQMWKSNEFMSNFLPMWSNAKPINLINAFQKVRLLGTWDGPSRVMPSLGSPSLEAGAMKWSHIHTCRAAHPITKLDHEDSNMAPRDLQKELQIITKWSQHARGASGAAYILRLNDNAVKTIARQRYQNE